MSTKVAGSMALINMQFQQIQQSTAGHKWALEMIFKLSSEIIQAQLYIQLCIWSLANSENSPQIFTFVAIEHSIYCQ